MSFRRRGSSLKEYEPLGATNLANWRLDSSDEGRHVWHYIRTDSTSLETVWGSDERNVKEEEQSVEAKYWLGMDLPTVAGLKATENPFEAAKKGYEFYKRLQSPDGHYSGEYGGE